MAAKDLILDFDAYDLDHVIADIDEIRRYNQQRFEMEQLTAIVYEDTTRHICVGYKDYQPDEFWVRGHMPAKPMLPGVMMCEAAAQLCSYYVSRHDLLGAGVVGFGGLDEVRFRDMVVPGDRLVVICAAERLRRGAMVVSWFQEFVGRTLVCDGRIRGVPLRIDEGAPQRESSAT